MADIRHAIRLDLDDFLRGQRRAQSASRRAARDMERDWERAGRRMERSMTAALSKVGISLSTITRLWRFAVNAIRAYEDQFPGLVRKQDEVLKGIEALRVGVGRDLMWAKQATEGWVEALEAARRAMVNIVSLNFGDRRGIDAARAEAEALAKRGAMLTAVGDRVRELDLARRTAAGGIESEIAREREEHRRQNRATADLRNKFPGMDTDLVMQMERAEAARHKQAMARIGERHRAQREAADAKLADLTAQWELEARLADLSDRDRDMAERDHRLARALADIHRDEAATADARAAATMRILEAFTRLDQAATRAHNDKMAREAAEQAQRRQDSLGDAAGKLERLGIEALRIEGRDAEAGRREMALRRHDSLAEIAKAEGLSDQDRAGLTAEVTAAYDRIDAAMRARMAQGTSSRLIEAGSGATASTIKQVFASGRARDPQETTAETVQKQLRETTRHGRQLRQIARNTARRGATFE